MADSGTILQWIMEHDWQWHHLTVKYGTMSDSDAIKLWTMKLRLRVAPLYSKPWNYDWQWNHLSVNDRTKTCSHPNSETLKYDWHWCHQTVNHLILNNGTWLTLALSNSEPRNYDWQWNNLQLQWNMEHDWQWHHLTENHGNMTDNGTI